MRLTIITTTLALAALTACQPGPMTVIDGPEGKPDCVGDVVLIEWYEWADSASVDCRLVPPQMLAKRMPDLTTAARTDCHDRGGSVLVDNTAGSAYCLDLDY